MCIRDRRSSVWRGVARVALPSLFPPPVCPGRAVGECSAGAAPCRHRAGQGAPVSYTHLTLPTICSV
eukprot:10649602-Alexandrium_andersonii.AAC.1